MIITMNSINTIIIIMYLRARNLWRSLGYPRAVRDLIDLGCGQLREGQAKQKRAVCIDTINATAGRKLTSHLLSF
jgi:hypothetical protein